MNSSGLFSEIEMPLAAVLADMEETGFLIDRAGLAEYGEVLSKNQPHLRLKYARRQALNSI